MTFRRAQALFFAAALAACGSGSADPAKHASGDQPGETAVARPDDGLVRLTPAQAKTAKIETAPAQRRSESAAIVTTGEIEPPEDGVARVAPKVTGRVARLSKGVGDPVKRGEVLAVIDSPDLGRAKADYIAALAAAKVTREVADREQGLYEKKISSEKDWRQAEADATRARAEKEAAEVRMHTLGLSDGELAGMTPEDHFASSFPVSSPIEGVVVERPVTLGQLAQPSDPMFVVMDLKNVWVLVDVYERDLSQVKIGQTVTARVPAWKDRAFTGTVGVIGAVVDHRSRTIKVRVVLPNADGALKPGMFTTVEIAGTTGAPHEGVYVPGSAVQRDGERDLVFVQRGDDEFEPRTVKIGQSAHDWVEIQSGVAEGEKVVVAGAFALKSELKKGELGGDE